MSYSRFGWDGSDVYVYMDINGYLHCCMCPFQKLETIPEEDRDNRWAIFRVVEPIVVTKFYSTAEMIAHLQEHIKAGHTVPDSVIPELLEDDQRNFGKEATWLNRKKPLKEI